MNVSLGFGIGVQEAFFPDRNFMAELQPIEIEPVLTGEAELRRALSAPISCGMLSTLIRPENSIVILAGGRTDDVPVSGILPVLLDELYAAGAERKNISLVFGTGRSGAHTPDELKKLAGERAFREITCVDCDSSDCVSLGTTSSGIPAELAKNAVSADFRILIGNIGYNDFFGYSGGASVLTDFISEAAAKKLRLLISRPGCRPGTLGSNPLRTEIEEIAGFAGVNFILNTVIGERQDIIRAVAGDFIEAHRSGCRFLDGLFLKKLPHGADIVLVSPGGSPRDSSLCASVRALSAANCAVRHGGIIIMTAECRNGFGPDLFFETLQAAMQPKDVLSRLPEGPAANNEPAVSLAKVVQHANVYLVSSLDDDAVKSAFLAPKPTLQVALDDAFGKLGHDAGILVIPYGSVIMPAIIGT